jgi:hypothetical protein
VKLITEEYFLAKNATQFYVKAVAVLRGESDSIGWKSTCGQTAGRLVHATEGTALEGTSLAVPLETESGRDT